MCIPTIEKFYGYFLCSSLEYIQPQKKGYKPQGPSTYFTQYRERDFRAFTYLQLQAFTCFQALIEMEREIQLADDTGEHAEDSVIDAGWLISMKGKVDTGEHAEDSVIDAGWLISMKGKAASACAKSSPPFTICRVPKHIRDSDPAAYSPRIISIGPFHRKSTNAMEVHKWRYLHKVLSKPENDIEKCLKEMKAKEALARNWYSESIPLASKEFVEMMVLDGCFILQLIHEQNNGDRKDDPIYCDEWKCKSILHDMLLLENQLPFFVLEYLWVLSGPHRGTLMDEALNFFRRAFPDDELALEWPEEREIHHLLHAVHLSLKPAARKLSSMPPSRTKTVPCAMELQDAGFRFQRKRARSFFDVTFEEGLMKMPRLRIDDDTNALFRNFIAFEQCFPECGNHFTSYCLLINALVNTPRDVSILSQSNIIENMLGSNEAVANLFNKLLEEIWDFEHSYLANMFEEVNQHTQKLWAKWRAKLVHDYFSYPGIIISPIVVIIILIVILVGTFFAVFAYFRPLKP